MLVECEEYGQHFDQNMSDYYRTIKQKLTEKPILCLETEEVLSESHGFLYETKEGLFDVYNKIQLHLQAARLPITRICA